MMSYNPRREVIKSVLSENFIQTDALIVPKATVGYKIVRPPKTTFDTGIILFAITMTFKLIFSEKSDYAFEAVSVTEIIDDKKPLKFFGLKMISDREIEELFKIFNQEVVKKGMIFTSPFKNEVKPEVADLYLNKELDRFLATEQH